MKREMKKEGGRGRFGYGSSYRKGGRDDLGQNQGIGTVLGGQVWMIEPDMEAGRSNPCIWMQAGVVPFKSCNHYYDCTSCKYDRAMEQKAARGRQKSWREAMREREGLDRICRHSLTRRIEKRSCAYDYECSRCDFDQLFEEVWTTRTGSLPSEVREIKGFRVPSGYYYHEGHTWARIESGGTIRVGMDDFALKLLGRADAFDLPLMGKELSRGRAGWGLKRGDNPADVLSPVSGVVLEVNPRLREHPKTANRDPYGNGWLFVLHNRDIKSSVKPLISDNECMNWIRGEVDILEGMIEEVAGPLAADGGTLAEDIFGKLPGLGWKTLTSTFLKTG